MVVLAEGRQKSATNLGRSQKIISIIKNMAEQENLESRENNSEATPEQKKFSEELEKVGELSADGGAKEEPRESFLRKAIEKTIQRTVNESRLPSEGYESTVGVYGGKIKTEDGKMVLDRRGIVSKIDKAGDAVLRTFDEHVVKDPWKLLKMHPKWALKFLAPGPKRYRGSNEEVLENVERLGLSDLYGSHKNGIEIKNPEVFKKGVHLQDIYRADAIGSEKLEGIDRFQALGEAAKYARKMHDEHGAVGELNVFHFMFQRVENGQVKDPTLYIPDIVWNKEKSTSEVDKKTTDMLDFVSSAFVEEFRRSKSMEDAEKALDTILDNYGDSGIISMIESFVKRGRLTLQGDKEILNLPNTITKKARGIFAQHNKARIGSKTDFEGTMKGKIIESCERFLSKNKK
jgi:hypothetical protein